MSRRHIATQILFGACALTLLLRKCSSIDVSEGNEANLALIPAFSGATRFAQNALQMSTTAGSAPGPGHPPSQTEFKVALAMIFVHEGPCGNDAKDKGNQMNGRIGYTCMGVTPNTGWSNRKFYGYCMDKCQSDPVMFTKCCYDMDKAKYKQGTEQIYVENYFKAGGCMEVEWPTFYVCGDIAINSGVGRSREYLSKLGPCKQSAGCDPVAKCREWNAKGRQMYKDIVAKNPSQNKFLKGWLRRADDRDKVCNGDIPASALAAANASPPVQSTPPTEQPTPTTGTPTTPTTTPTTPTPTDTPPTTADGAPTGIMNDHFNEGEVDLPGDDKCKAQNGKCQYNWTPCAGRYTSPAQKLCGGPDTRLCCLPAPPVPPRPARPANVKIREPILIYGDQHSVYAMGKAFFDTIDQFMQQHAGVRSVYLYGREGANMNHFVNGASRAGGSYSVDRTPEGEAWLPPSSPPPITKLGDLLTRIKPATCVIAVGSNDIAKTAISAQRTAMSNILAAVKAAQCSCFWITPPPTLSQKAGGRKFYELVELTAFELLLDQTVGKFCKIVKSRGVDKNLSFDNLASQSRQFGDGRLYDSIKPQGQTMAIGWGKATASCVLLGINGRCSDGQRAPPEGIDTSKADSGSPSAPPQPSSTPPKPPSNPNGQPRTATTPGATNPTGVSPGGNPTAVGGINGAPKPNPTGPPKPTPH